MVLGTIKCSKSQQMIQQYFNRFMGLYIPMQKNPSTIEFLKWESLPRLYPSVSESWDKI